MPHCINLNDTPAGGPITEAEFEALHRAMHDDEQPAPAEAATEIGQDVTMPYDGENRRLGHAITAVCAVITLAVICAGLYFKT